MGRISKLIPLVCLIAGLLLIGAEWLNSFVIENVDGEAIALVGAGERHSYAFVLLGLLAILGTVLAVGSASRPAAVMVPVAGLAALALFAILDLPDAGATDLISDANRDLAEGTAEPGGAFWTVLIGAVLCTTGGALLATLSPAQLRGLRPGHDAG